MARLVKSGSATLLVAMPVGENRYEKPRNFYLEWLSFCTGTTQKVVFASPEFLTIN
jgi:hypothetical protein